MTVTDETIHQPTTGTGLDGFFASTPSFEVPIPPPEIHQGEITGVLFVPNTNGPGGRIQVGLKSTNTGIETEYSFFPPLPFVENIYAPADSYSPDKPYNDETEKFGMSEAEIAARHVSNTTGTATLQVLTGLAASQGHTTNLPQPTNIEELATVLNDLLAGVSVVFTRSVDQNPRDPQYATVLRVRKVVGPELASNTKKMKYYRNNKYFIAWD